LPTPYAPHDRSFIDAGAQQLRDCPVPTPAPQRSSSAKADEMRARREQHPVHRCPDRSRHVEARRILAGLQRDIEGLEKQLLRRSGSVVRRFEALVDLLSELGMVDGWALSASGEQLARTYHESDLLVVLALADGVLDGLDAPSLAAMVSGLTYEERRPETAPRVRYPTDEVRRRFVRLERVAAALNKAERSRGLPITRPPSAGFAALAHAWASGRELGDLLDGDVSGGDFVRNIRLLVDLLRQIGDHAPDLGTRRSARQASAAMHRGVVDSTPTVPDATESAGSVLPDVVT
jgi:ATP-dependent RNA helicase HelY